MVYLENQIIISMYGRWIKRNHPKELYSFSKQLYFGFSRIHGFMEEYFTLGTYQTHLSLVLFECKVCTYNLKQ